MPLEIFSLKHVHQAKNFFHHIRKSCLCVHGLRYQNHFYIGDAQTFSLEKQIKVSLIKKYNHIAKASMHLLDHNIALESCIYIYI